MGCDAHLCAVPVHHHELLLLQFASDDNLRQETDSHSREDALFDGLYAGELRDVLRPYIGGRQLHVELLTVSAAGLGQQQSLIRKILWIHLPCATKRMIRRSEEIDVFG